MSTHREPLGYKRPSIQYPGAVVGVVLSVPRTSSYRYRPPLEAILALRCPADKGFAADLLSRWHFVIGPHYAILQVSPFPHRSAGEQNAPLDGRPGLYQATASHRDVTDKGGPPPDNHVPPDDHLPLERSGRVELGVPLYPEALPPPLSRFQQARKYVLGEIEERVLGNVL